MLPTRRFFCSSFDSWPAKFKAIMHCICPIPRSWWPVNPCRLFAKLIRVYRVKHILFCYTLFACQLASNFSPQKKKKVLTLILYATRLLDAKLVPSCEENVSCLICYLLHYFILSIMLKLARAIIDGLALWTSTHTTPAKIPMFLIN